MNEFPTTAEKHKDTLLSLARELIEANTHCETEADASSALDDLAERFKVVLRLHADPIAVYTLEETKRPSLTPLVSDSTTVRIWSGQWNSYWRNGGSGYTENRAEAGLYTFSDALKLSGHCGPEKKIIYEILP